jgi:hypothetical protein
VSEAAIFKALGGGGVALFACLVLYILREQTPVLKAIRDELFELRITDAARLERDRRREARNKRDSDQPLRRGPMPSLAPPPRNEFDVEETTDIVTIREQERARAVRPNVRTPAVGVRIPRPGTHHDEDR